jgi:hypothetical protein
LTDHRAFFARFGFGVLGVVLAVFILHRALWDRSKQRPVPDKSVPPGVLRLIDSSDVLVATLTSGYDGSRGFQVLDSDGGSILTYTETSTRDRNLNVSSDDGGFLNLLISATSGLRTPHSLLLHRPGEEQPRIRQWVSWEFNQSAALPPKLNTFVKRAYRQRFSEERNRWTAVNLLPVQDLRLTDREGRPFAVLGLVATGEPSLVLHDRDGKNLIWWGLEKNVLSNVTVFDQSSYARIFVDIMPGRALELFIEKTDVQQSDFSHEHTKEYVVDPTSGDETPRDDEHPGSIPWLTYRLRIPVMPLRLIDQHNRTIWKGP